MHFLSISCYFRHILSHSLSIALTYCPFSVDFFTSFLFPTSFCQFPVIFGTFLLTFPISSTLCLFPVTSGTVLPTCGQFRSLIVRVGWFFFLPTTSYAFSVPFGPLPVTSDTFFLISRHLSISSHFLSIFSNFRHIFAHFRSISRSFLSISGMFPVASGNFRSIFDPFLSISGHFH